MNGFLETTFTRKKFQGLFINTALGNFAGYVAGSLVTIASTHSALEGRALRNLFGVLPRKKVVVHLLPHWLEWFLALMVGFLVMEVVRYCFNYGTHAAFLKAAQSAESQPQNSGQATGQRDAGGPCGTQGAPFDSR